MKPLELLDLDAVMALMKQRLSAFKFDTETLPLKAALGRKVAASKTAHFAVPGFKRSAVDGFAVKMSDFTNGACTLKCVGRVEMGKPILQALEVGETLYVPTGGMVPQGAEAMVMQEYASLEGGLAEGLAQFSGKKSNEPFWVTFKAEPNWDDHVVAADEDFKENTVLVEVGTLLSPAHLGKLAAAGYETVEVFCRPKVWILSTGNELIEPPAKLEAGKVYNLNGVALEALSVGMGFEVVGNSWCHDDEAVLHEAMASALEVADMVILSGGSSVGEKDGTAKAVNLFNPSETLFHGIRIKPGKPTLLAQVGPNNKLVLGLPGHPASAYMIMTCFGGYLAEQVWHSKAVKQPVAAVLSHDLKAAVDRDQLVLVSLSAEASDYPVEIPPALRKGSLQATVLSGKSAAISRLAEADGYFLQRVGEAALKKGDSITVASFA